MKLARLIAMLLIVLSALGGAQFLFSQGTDLGTIRGLVTEATGAVVPNAKVVIIDLATNTSRETKTNAEGEYRVFGLRPGKYEVDVSAPNMRTTQVTGIRLMAVISSLRMPTSTLHPARSKWRLPRKLR